MNIPRVITLCRSNKFFTHNLPVLLKINPAFPCDKRAVSTVQTRSLGNESLLKRILKKIPFIDPYKTKIITAGYILYERIADQLNYVEFIEELDLADTFYSWFVLTELHIWMLSVRAMAEGKDGKELRNSMVAALWSDVAQRVKKLDGANPSAARVQIGELSEQFQAALIAYDEGLQSDDVVLANVLWRRFYQQNEVIPENLDCLVKYVRKQMRLLDNVSYEMLIEKKQISWESIK